MSSADSLHGPGDSPSASAPPPEDADRERRLRELLSDCLDRRAAGELVPDAALIAQYPDLMPELADGLARLRRVNAAADMAHHLAGTDDAASDWISLNPDMQISDTTFNSDILSLSARDPFKPDAAMVELADYRIVRELHSGGQGIVYEAVQLSTRRTVAIKLLLEGPSATRRSQQRFEREIELIASLRHPNIVAIHDSGITRGQYYYAMDYVRGQPLDTHVRLARPDVRGIMRLARTICEAMAYAHRMGVIHRDLKPSNILVDNNGEPIIIDFGLARILGAVDQGGLTMPGVLLGTVPYMSPEQTLGRPDAIDTRSDVYSLGVILFELLTGAPPYPTRGVDLPAAFENIRTVDPPRISRWCREANTEIDAIVMKAMEKEADRRYASASEMTEDIVAWLEGRPVQAKSASSLYVIRKLAMKHSFETLVILALVLATGSVFTLGVQQYWAWRASTRQALAQQQFSEAALAGYLHDLRPQNDAASAAVTRANMAWFLLEWEARHDAAAADVYQQTPTHHLERHVMAYLLDERASLQDLLAQLPPDAEALAHFAAGERLLRAGQRADARLAFEQAWPLARGPRHAWLWPLIRTRLIALGAPPETPPAGATGGRTWP